MLRILVVDTHTAFRDSLTRLLANRFSDAVVATADTCGEGRERIAACAYHMAFVNIHLDSGNGLEMARELKMQHPGVTTLALADCDLPEYHVAIRRASIDFFIPKDQWSSEKMLALVDSIVTTEDGAGAGSAAGD